MEHIIYRLINLMKENLNKVKNMDMEYINQKMVKLKKVLGKMIIKK